MRARKSTFQHLVKMLVGPVDPPSDWRPLIRLAGDTLTIGTLASAVLTSEYTCQLAENVRDLLADVLERARERNRRLKQQLLEAVPSLDAIGVRPILMRGIAFLLEDGDADSDRLLSDIDILVPADRREECIQTFRSLGYEVFQGFHGPPFSVTLARSQDVGMIDLHTDIQPYSLGVDYDGLAPLCRGISVAGGEVLLPSPTCALLLFVLHDQLHDADYWRGVIDVRHLVEIPALANHGIEWDTLASFFPPGAARNAMNVYLQTAKVVLAIEIPDECCGGWWAGFQVRRRLLQLAMPELMPIFTALTAVSDPPFQLAKSSRPKKFGLSALYFSVGRALRPINAGKL